MQIDPFSFSESPLGFLNFRAYFPANPCDLLVEEPFYIDEGAYMPHTLFEEVVMPLLSQVLSRVEFMMGAATLKRIKHHDQPRRAIANGKTC